MTSFDSDLWHCVLHVSFKSTDSPSHRKYESLDMSTSQSYVILDVPCEDAHGAAGPPLRCTNINTLDWNVGQICWYLFNLLNNSFAKEKEGSFVHIIRERCTNGDQRTSYRLSILS